MTAEKLDEKAIFNAARQIESPDARDAYVRQACGADVELIERVETLLRGYEEQASFLESPAANSNGHATLGIQIAERPGEMIGPYKLLQQIGEGGMGVVFMAEQTEPIQRTVALKIIKPGMDSRQVIARFEAERQALALMDHPNIAKVLDAGTTESGRPYFVMELVKGVPITKYCDDKRLPLRQRLELFLPVCQAVQHAHQKGIIHRDLKPTNVLVAEYDNRAVPKIIDFGVAKATAQKLTESTMFTEFGQIIGTVEYMSPEQAKFNQLDIDTRSDVYSLGVLLYELLTGSTPFERQHLREAAFDEVLRIIREEDPPKPSTRLSSSEGLPSIAANRQSLPTKLNQEVRGDLDWIVMKCLEKDRNERYQSPLAIAQDLQRHLASEPIEARPPSNWYLFTKFARRNKVALISSAMIVGLLIGGTAVSTWLAIRATTAERQAKQNEARAISNSKQKERISQFLIEAFRSPDPAQDGRGAKIADVLDRAVQRLNAEAIDDPITQAALLETIGETYLSLGLSQEAIPVLEKARTLRASAMTERHRDTLTSSSQLAQAYYRVGRSREAAKLNEETLALRKAEFGPDDEDTLTSMINLATDYVGTSGKTNDGIALLEEAKRRASAKFGPESASSQSAQYGLGAAYLRTLRVNDAVSTLEGLLEIRKRLLGATHPDTLASMNDLAVAYDTARRSAEAVQIQQQLLSIKQQKFGKDHPSTITSMHNLALAEYQIGQRESAIRLLEESLKLREAKSGPDHPETTNTRNHLADMYRALGRTSEAQVEYQRVLRQRTERYGAAFPSTILTAKKVVTICLLTGKWNDALPLLAPVMDVHGSDPEVSILHGHVHAASGQMSEARADFQDAIASTSKQPSMRPQLEMAWRELAYWDDLFDKIKESHEGDSICPIARAQHHIMLGQWKEAEAILLKARTLDPTNKWFNYYLCILLAKNESSGAFERLCSELLKQAGSTNDADLQDKAAKVALLRPSAIVDLQRACATADESVKAEKPVFLLPWTRLAKSMAELRRKNFEAAVDWSRQSIESESSPLTCRVSAWLVQASAADGAKSEKSAQTALSKGEELLEHHRNDYTLFRRFGQPYDQDWPDWLIAEILYQEVLAQMKREPAPNN